MINIAFYYILGIPVIVYLGIFTYLSFLIAAYLGMLSIKGKGSLGRHKTAVRIAFIIATIHALVGISLILK
ncbi:MAG: hypothetical protein WC520_02805 [Candidatus Paceibacterota bacterium]